MRLVSSKSNAVPQIPIPPPLRGAEAGSFAQAASFAADTILRRLPEIARRVIAENSFDPPTNDRLSALAANLPHGRVRPLLDEQAPDWADWQAALRPFLGQSWLELPLFAAEMVFYRRILEATGYFQPGAGYGVDPYRLQKELGLAQAAPALAQALPQGLPPAPERLSRLLALSLWANQADLSLWPVQGDRGGKAGGGRAASHLLVDQSRTALHALEALPGGRVDLLLDNFGSELCFDLLLADALLARSPAISLRLHVKPHPCFVSDVIAADLARAVACLQIDCPAWASPIAQRLEQAQQARRLQVATHFYWASPHPAWEMPLDLWAELSDSSFLISKGDVNYRRWLGDARWPAATPLEAIITPPAPLLLLRVSKSDVVAGLNPGQAEELPSRDPDWQVNGMWGMIQFVGRGRERFPQSLPGG